MEKAIKIDGKWSSEKKNIMDVIDKIWRKKYRLRLLDYDGLSKGTISECFNKICILCYRPCYIRF